MEKDMDMGIKLLVMGRVIVDFGSIIIALDMELINGLVVVNTQEILSLGIIMDGESTHGIMEKYTKVNTKMMKKTGMVQCFSLMVDDMLENESTICIMEKEY